MLEQYFRRPSSVTQLRAGPFGQVVEEFAVYLHEHGYAFKVGQAYVRRADRVTRWLAAKGLSPKDLDEKRCQAFCRSRDGQLRPAYTRDGVRRFLQMLRDRGIAPTPPTKPLSSCEQLVAEYDVYLRDVVGLALATRVSRSRFAREFLQYVAGRGFGGGHFRGFRGAGVAAGVVQDGLFGGLRIAESRGGSRCRRWQRLRLAG